MKLIRISSMWCTSCIVTKKSWDEIKQKYEYEEYDYDLDEQIVKQYNVGNILPVIIILNNGVEINRIIGEKSKKEIEKILGD